jgi:hypothetical protein
MNFYSKHKFEEGDMSLLKLITKVGLLTLLTISVSASSDEPVIETAVEQSIETPAEPVYAVTQHSQSCPEDFYSLPLMSEPQFCQQFSTDLPASMSYHAKSDQYSVKDFYLERMGQAENENTLKGRIVLQYNNGQKIVIISPDGKGSQIDILVKSAN